MDTDIMRIGWGLWVFAPCEGNPFPPYPCVPPSFKHVEIGLVCARPAILG